MRQQLHCQIFRLACHRAGRRLGQSDSIHAEDARADAGRNGFGSAESGTTAMEMVRALRVARQSAIKARTQAANEVHILVVTAPDAMRAQPCGLKLLNSCIRAAAFRRNPELTTPAAAYEAGGQVDRRAIQATQRRDRRADKHLDQLVGKAAPSTTRND